MAESGIGSLIAELLYFNDAFQQLLYCIGSKVIEERNGVSAFSLHVIHYYSLLTNQTHTPTANFPLFFQESLTLPVCIHSITHSPGS